MTTSNEELCKCSFRIRIVGDGCRHCQPQTYIDSLHYIIEEQRVDIATLEQESAANLQRALVAEKDAARYRYLRDEGDGFTIDVREQDIDGENWVTGYAAQELDEAIDAARAPDTSTQEVG